MPLTKRLPVIPIAITCFAVSAFFLNRFIGAYADNPDTFQYLEVARLISNGAFSDAINGYWGPLLSWLLVIPAAVSGDDLHAFRLLQCVLAVLTIIVLHRLAMKTAGKISAAIITLLSIPFLLSYSLFNLTADLLFLLLSLLLISFYCEPAFKSRTAWATGFIGGFMYLTKAFGFPFFIALTCIHFFVFRKDYAGSNVARQTFARIAGVFVLICGLWIAVLSAKYGELTISKSAAFNFTEEVSPVAGEIVRLPVIDDGLSVPPDAATSAWFEPGEARNLTPLNPFGNFDYIQLVKRNVLTIYHFHFNRQAGVVFFLLLILVITFRRKKFNANKNTHFLLLALLVLYGGYSLILVHTRYIWPGIFLMIVLAASFLKMLSGRKILVAPVLIFIMLWFSKSPVKEILFSTDKDIDAGTLIDACLHPASTLEKTYEPDRCLKQMADEMKTLKLHGGFVSVGTNDLLRSGYASALYLAYTLEEKYYGRLEDEEVEVAEISNVVADEILDLKINADERVYVIDWKNKVSSEEIIYENCGAAFYELKLIKN